VFGSFRHGVLRAAFGAVNAFAARISGQKLAIATLPAEHCN
jgi:hypothetical protein